jgi:hypothetical protein
MNPPDLPVDAREALTFVDGTGQGADSATQIATSAFGGVCTIHAQHMHNSYANPVQERVPAHGHARGMTLAMDGRNGKGACRPRKSIRR